MADDKKSGNSFDTRKLDPIMYPAYKAYKSVKGAIQSGKDAANDVAQAASSIGDKSKNVDAAKKAGDSQSASPSSYKHGGLVKKSGMAKVHKGERVLTKSQNRKRMSK